MKGLADTIGGFLALAITAGVLVSLWVACALLLGMFIGIVSRGFHLVA